LERKARFLARERQKCAQILILKGNYKDFEQALKQMHETNTD
jgi:hypothetical protein